MLIAIRMWLWRRELRVAHGFGLGLRWIVNEGRLALLGLVLTAVAVLVFQHWSILALYGLVILALLAYRARRSVVVAEFVDHTSDNPENGEAPRRLDKDAKPLRGAATLLVIELARLQALYRVVDERRAIGTAVGEGRPLDATVKVEALSEVLRSAVSAESKVSVGPITIPIGALMALLGRLVEGPQLTGALHKDGDSLILTAQLSGGGGRDHSWRVRGDSRSREFVQKAAEIAPDRSPLINEMIEQLACRMFSDLTLAKAVNWRATHHFINALRAFRRCLRVARGRKLNLKVAERELIEAFSEDDGFVLVFYNLGVVYTELWRMALHEAKAMRTASDPRAKEAADAKDIEAADQLHAAEAAFSRAIEQDPGRWEAYYALALTRFERGRRYSVVEQCERVLALGPPLANRAKAYDLKGLAEYRRDEPLVAEARKSAKRAATDSLKALRRAELLRMSAPGSEIDPVPPLKDQTARCLLNYGVVLAHQPPQGTKRRIEGLRTSLGLRRVEAPFKLALSLTNRDAVLHYEFGKIAERWNCLDVAATEFTHATRIDPDQAAYWANLAGVHARLFRLGRDEERRRDERKKALHACDRSLQVINLSSITDDDRQVRELVAATYQMIGERAQARRVMAMGDFAKRIGVLEWKLQLDSSELDKVARWIKHYREQGNDWEAAHLERLLGVAKLNSGDPRKAESHFREAIRVFDRVNPEEVRRYAIRARLASAVAAQGDEKALAEAERALAVDPLRKLERYTLGQMYFDLHDYEHAREVWESALLWSPNDPELHWRLSECQRQLAEEETRPSDRRESFEKAAAYLLDALELYGGESIDNRLRAHYWLGRLYSNLRDFPKVIAHLRIVQTKAELEIIVDLRLGEALLRVKRYREAEEAFSRVIDRGEERLKRAARASVGVEVQDEMPLALVVAHAYWGRALSDAERDGNLKRALNDLDEAKRHIEAVEKRSKDGANLHLAVTARACVDCRGWVMFKQNHLDDAINLFQDAILLGAESETYIHLALAYEAKVAESGNGTDRASLARVRVACEHAIDTDMTGDAKARADEILARLSGVAV